MVTIVAPRLDSLGNETAIIDANTQETLFRNRPAWIDEDFLGPGHSTFPTFGTPATGYPWVQKTVKTNGSPSVAILANSGAGIVALALDATSEAQEATLYANDQRNWDVTKGTYFETRVAYSVIPGALVEIVFGLQAAWASPPDSNTSFLRFQSLASGLVNVQSFDGITTRSVASTTTLAAGAFHIFSCDARDQTNVLFAIDGNRVTTPSPIAFAAIGLPAILQPYVSVYKASGTGVGTVQVDMIQVAMDRV